MKQKYTGLVILNTVSLLIMLFANYAGNTNLFSTATVADISHKYDTLFAPAGYAFIIWGVIFLLTISFVIYQWVLLQKGDPKQFIKRTGIWFTLSNFANACWVYFWVNENTGISVLLILLLLFCLIKLTINLRLELDDEPVRNILFVWWPVCFYIGWIMVATIACIAAWLVSIEWNSLEISENVWTIILIAVACLLYLMLIYKRNMREAALVGVWAFIAIAVRQWGLHKSIAIEAIACSLILILASGIHIYKNKQYTIGVKLKRGEW